MNDVDVVREAEVSGGVVVPAVVAIGYALYLLIAVDTKSTNGVMLLVLGFLALAALFLAPRWPMAVWLPIGLGWYTFGILGCAGLGLALSETSGWTVIGGCLFWLLFGWYALNRAARFRRSMQS